MVTGAFFGPMDEVSASGTETNPGARARIPVANPGVTGEIRVPVKADEVPSHTRKRQARGLPAILTKILANAAVPFWES